MRPGVSGRMPLARVPHWLKNAIGFLITFLCLYAVLSQIQIAEVFEAYQQIQWIYLALGIVSLSVGYALRIFRWSMMLRIAKASTSWRLCVAPFLGSIALNNILPLRIGDVVRAIVFPRVMGISKVTATSSLLMERLIDLVTLLLSLAVGLTIAKGTELPVWLVESTILVAIITGIVFITIFLYSGRLSLFFARISEGQKKLKIANLYLSISKILHDLEAMSRPRVLFSVIFISMIIWTGEAGLFYCLLLGLGLDAHPALAMIIMSVATLSTIIPSSPGYVGPFHLAAFVVISSLGGTATEAGSYAILTHFVLWVSTTLAGSVAIIVQPALFRSMRLSTLSATTGNEK